MAQLLDVTTMMAPSYEPKRNNRWVLQWDGIPGFILKTFARPSLNFNEVVIDYINTKRYFQGKFEWQSLSIVTQDPIVPSAAQNFMEWVRLGYENISGRVGYKDLYAAKNFSLQMLDGPGAVVEQWDFINIFPTSVNFGTLDYASAEIATVECTLRFDSVLLSY